METVSIARNAMATRFEILLYGENAVGLRAAAEEALDEIERLGVQLSLYNPASDISYINEHASAKPVRIEPRLFRLLQTAQRLSRESGGVFDITIAPLMQCWGFMGASGSMPSPEAVAAARARTGMHFVQLREEDFTIHFQRAGMMLDLGSIGKGYALEEAAEILREAGVTSALLHGGTSTVYAIGAPPDEAGWKVAVEAPPPLPDPASGSQSRNEAGPQLKETLAVVLLRDESLSVSGVHGKFFDVGTKRYGHVIDPRYGEPVQSALLAAVVLPSATETDGLSTALLTSGIAGHQAIAQLRPEMRTLVVAPGEGSGPWRIESHGITVSK